MKKFKKVLKIFLLLIVIVLCILIFVAAAVWLQSAGWIGNRAESLEDALQAVLGGNPDPVEDETAFNAENLDETENSKLPEEMQEPDEAAESADTTEPVLSTEDLPLRDLYGAPGQIVRFHVYHPGAVNYVWEYYDMELRKWQPAVEDLAGSERDMLGRMTAYADFETPADQPELMIRCLYVYETADAGYETEETGEQVSEMAFLRALPQEIRKLTLAEESIAAEAGSYLAACDIAVKVTYADNTSDVIEGLYGLYFMESEVEAESSEFISAGGILTERKVQTTLTHFCPYRFVSAGEESITLAYIPDTESQRLQLSGTLTGTDEEAPVISKVDILTREDILAGEDVPGSKGEISMTILVTAEDNVTPYPRLQYAVKDTAGEDTYATDVDVGEIAEEDWIDCPRITMALPGGSTWLLYCRDQAGNVSIYKYEDPPEELPALAEKSEPEEKPDLAERSEEPPEAERDTQAPVIRNIYVEAN